jgi:hypothetical protein
LFNQDEIFSLQKPIKLTVSDSRRRRRSPQEQPMNPFAQQQQQRDFYPVFPNNNLGRQQQSGNLRAATTADRVPVYFGDDTRLMDEI